MKTIVCNPDREPLDVEKLRFLLSTFFDKLPVTIENGQLFIHGEVLHKIVGHNETTAKRMWINQPSTLQPLHHRHGENVLAVHEHEDTARVYFLDGDVESQVAKWLWLSPGWLSEKPPRVTYWLYYNHQPIYAVRLPPGSSDQDVKSAALRWHDRVPICYPEYNPSEFGHMILNSTVRR